jgi:hypothetical protein
LPPAYVDPIAAIYPAISIHQNKSTVVDVFPYYDPENGTVTVEAHDSSANPVNFTVSSNYSQVTIFTTSFSQVGWHWVKIILKD